jgi:hypothetical protein
MTIITVTQASTKADLIFNGVHVCWPLAHTITHLPSIKSRQGHDANRIFVGFQTLLHLLSINPGCSASPLHATVAAHCVRTNIN